MSEKTIIDTEFCKVIKVGTELIPFIKCSASKQWIEHAHFDAGLKGVVASLILATDCCAGKFAPIKAVAFNESQTKPESNQAIMKMDKLGELLLPKRRLELAPSDKDIS